MIEATAIEHRDLYEKPFSALKLQSCKMEKDCVLIDEKNPLKKPLRVSSESQKIDLLYNLKQKRKMIDFVEA